MFFSLNISTEACAGGVEFRKYYVTLITEGNCNAQYIATCESKISNSTFKMDRFTSFKDRNNWKWKYPLKYLSASS